MKLLLVSVLVVLSSVISCIASAEQALLAGVGTTVDYQLSTSGRTYEPIAPWSVRAGYRFKFADVYAEYSYSHSSSGTDIVSVAQSNQEFLVWIRKGDPTSRVVMPYIAVGAGAHLASVSTRYGSSVDNEAGTLEGLAAVAGGVEWRVMRAFSVSIEGRATTAEGYAPNPLFGLGGYLSFIF